jgi:dUTP pyrophosphatase
MDTLQVGAQRAEGGINFATPAGTDGGFPFDESKLNSEAYPRSKEEAEALMSTKFGVLFDVKMYTGVKVPVICTGELPRYARQGDAGCDGIATEAITISPGRRAIIPLGIRVAIPEGYEIQVRPRSGLAVKHGITVLNAPGTVDCGFTGEIGAILINHGTAPFEVNVGDRVCQLVLSKFETISWELVEELPTTERGEGGFGSSGK